MYRGRFDIVRSQLLVGSRSEEEVNDLTCGICADIVTNPVSCSGCRKLFCLKCSILWKSQQDVCPFKCQRPWKLDEHKTSEILLRCPYGEFCASSHPEDLMGHIACCGFAPPEILRDLQLKREYMCANHHKLEFWISSFEDMTNSKCVECSGVLTCRSVCHQCKVRYCVNCRPPPCTKSHCPNGHPYIKRKASPTYVCDICGLKAGVMYSDVYDDIKCNFGVCSNCMVFLPESSPVTPDINHYQHCTNGHLLDFLAHSQTASCDHCHNISRVQRGCNQCQTKYCLDCKQIRINVNNKCHKKHIFDEVQHKVMCTRCRKCSTAIFDPLCNLALCVGCYRELFSEALNLQRTAGQQCSSSAKHNLRRCNRQQQCADCKRSMFCALQCPYCHEYYCLRCRPSKHRKEDHSGHPYTPAFHEYSPSECAICNQKCTQSMECDICLIRICLGCYEAI